MNQEAKEKLENDLHDEAYCPSCHHGEGIEIPNAAAVIQEAFNLGVASVKPVPEDKCASHTCDYYRQYLLHGPVELTHGGYHETVRTCLAWQERAESYYQNGKPVPVYIENQCTRWERKIRA